MILDDRLPRRYALAEGLNVTGTVRVLVVAEQRGLLEDTEGVIESMRGHGYRISPRLLRQLGDRS